MSAFILMMVKSMLTKELAMGLAKIIVDSSTNKIDDNIYKVVEGGFDKNPQKVYDGAIGLANSAQKAIKKL